MEGSRLNRRVTNQLVKQPTRYRRHTSRQLASSKEDSPDVTEQVDSISVMDGVWGQRLLYFVANLQKDF